MISYRFKNNSASPLLHSGSGIQFASGVYTQLSYSDILKLVDSQLTTWLTDNTLTFNDGTSDYSYTKALAQLQFTGLAKNCSFDNATNGYVATDVQAAIEESRSTAEGKARYAISCGFDGNTTVGRYLEYNSNVDSNVTGFVVPRASTLKELSLGVATNSTITFTIYRWDGSVETSLTTISLANVRTTTITGLNISLGAGWELRVKCTSGSCARPILFKFIQVV
jgi:hypothetical protein